MKGRVSVAVSSTPEHINRHQILLPDGTITYPKANTPKRQRKVKYDKEHPYIFRSTGNKLTPQQNTFVMEYLANGRKDATNAAIKAGYSLKNAQAMASHLLIHPNVQEEVQKQIQAQQKRVLLTADKVIKDVMEIARVCSEKVTLTDDRGQTMTRLVDANAALRAAELLGKSLKLWKEGEDKNDGNVKVNVVIKEDTTGKLEKKT